MVLSSVGNKRIRALWIAACCHEQLQTTPAFRSNTSLALGRGRERNKTQHQHQHQPLPANILQHTSTIQRGLAFRTKIITTMTMTTKNDDSQSSLAMEDSTETPTATAMATPTATPSTPIVGGDFAGLMATFDPEDGSFVPIPEYLVPNDLLEWGQEPKCLEVLVSEDTIEAMRRRNDNNNNNDDDDDLQKRKQNILRRVTTTVLPDTGCGIDNLETKVTRDEIDLDKNTATTTAKDRDDDDDNDNDNDCRLGAFAGFQYPLGKDKLTVETVFALPEETGVDRIRVATDLAVSLSDSGDDNDNDNGGDTAAAPRRFCLSKPVRLTLERRTSPVSSGGTISEGGGLDGRTVFHLLGDRLKGAKTFVDEPSITISTIDNNNNNNNNDDDDGLVQINLPANISIVYGQQQQQQRTGQSGGAGHSNSWTLKVCHTTHNGSRRVVSRRFPTARNDDHDNNGEGEYKWDSEPRLWVEEASKE